MNKFTNWNDMLFSWTVLFGLSGLLSPYIEVISLTDRVIEFTPHIMN